MIEILSDNSIAVFFEQLRGVRLSRLQIQGALIGGRFNALSLPVNNLQTVDLVLLSLGDLKRDVNLRLMVLDIGGDFYLRESRLLVHGGQRGNTLLHQIVAVFSVIDDEPRFLQRYVRP